MLNQKLKNMTRAETFFMVKLGENWREHIIEGHGHHVPDRYDHRLMDLRRYSSRADLLRTEDPVSQDFPAGRIHHLLHYLSGYRYFLGQRRHCGFGADG